MPEVRLAASAMRTRFECVLQGADAVALRAAGEEALAEIHATERELSCFRKDALLARLNREAATRAVRVPRRLLEVLRLCVALHAETQGAFDPAIGPLMRRHGFRGGDGAGDAGAAAGDAAAGACAAGRLADLRLDDGRGTVRYGHPRLELDLGGIGKGVALDRAAQVLADAGVEHALLHGGTSTMRALGAQLGGRPWPVAVADPADEERVLWRGGIAGEALSVSAPSGRTAAGPDGARHGHVMDPRRGAPAASPTRAAVARVAAGSGGAVAAPAGALPGHAAARADAWSTALLVLGRVPFEFREFAGDPGEAPADPADPAVTADPAVPSAP